MLVLTRKSSERILIGNNVELVVLSVQGQHVRLGVRAPAHIDVMRLPSATSLTGGKDGDSHSSAAHGR